MNVAIVCGYGMVADLRLRNYLGEVLEYASKHEIDALILSGGYTVKDAEESEARVMWRVMQPGISDVQLFFEERSISTLHNLLYSAQLIEETSMPVRELYIFCDSLRFLKVFCLSKLIFKQHDARVIDFERKEPFWMYLLQVPFTILQCLGAVCTPIEKLILLVRLRLRKTTQTDRG